MSSQPLFQRRALAVARACAQAIAQAVVLAASASNLAHAQQVPAAPPDPALPAAPARKVQQLEPVVVTGNPLRGNDLVAPISVLSGDELVLKRAGSLGETLNGLPGVSSSYFGPNANRPMIRGLDGDRVRVLSNAGASLDASSLSFDHAVPIDPLVVERIEVLRGPGALLYGGSAVGGVVNALDNRIPKYRLTSVSGAAEVRFGGAESERGSAALVEAGNGAFAIHADVSGRQTSDLHVPEHTPVVDGMALDRTDRVRNSAARTTSGSLGASWTFGSGHLGASVDTYDSTYGVVADPDVVIRMKRHHAGISGEVNDLSGPLRVLRVQLNDTRYQHEEVGGNGAIGTTFKTSGSEARVELEHAPIDLVGDLTGGAGGSPGGGRRGGPVLGPLRGLVGAQFENFDFSALGAEAFVPSTHTRRQALFLTEEMAWPLGVLSAGLRLEQAHIRSAGDGDPSQPKFGAPAERSFSLRSASLSNVYKVSEQWNLSGTFSATERAPTSFELYANGVHAATSAFERGDPSLESERGNNIDLALQWKSGKDRLRVGVYSARYSRFIALESTGASVDTFPEFAYRSVPARLHGVEIEGKRRLIDGLWSADLSGKLDLTRGINANTGEALPRLSPMRIAVGLDVGLGSWAGRVDVEHSARQDRVPANDTATPAYSIVNLSLTRKFQLGESDALWFVKLGNLGNTLAYNASTVDTIRSLVPLPGRSLKTGVRFTF